MRTNKIKILETIRQGRVGGGETHVLELASNLDKSKYEPVVLSFTPGPMVDELNNRGIRTEIVFTERAFDYNIWGKVKDFMQKENFDIVHAHGTRAMSNVFRSARKLKIPLLYTVHGWSFHLDQKYPVRRLRELSEKFLTNKADKTICVSYSNQKDGLERFNMKRSIVIYNAVDLMKFNPDMQFRDIRNELGVGNDKVLIGYIVRITGQKDPFTLLKGFKKVTKESKDAVLLIVGEGDLKDETVNLAKELKLDNQLIFQPFRSDIPDILNAIDIYCLPSLWEGFPIGILEAMAMRKTVVASSVDGNKELIKEGETGLMLPHSNPDKLAEVLLKAIKDEQLREKLSENGYQFIKKQFGIERLIKEIDEVYENMIS